jgi:hypothetical protein
MTTSKESFRHVYRAARVMRRCAYQDAIFAGTSPVHAAIRARAVIHACYAWTSFEGFMTTVFEPSRPSEAAMACQEYWHRKAMEADPSESMPDWFN